MKYKLQNLDLTHPNKIEHCRLKNKQTKQCMSLLYAGVNVT